MTTKLALPVVLVGTALAAAGCGGSSSSSSSGGTGTVAGTVATLTTSTSTTARGSASFNARFGKVQAQLQQGLRQLENGNMVGAGAVLRNCTDTVTKQLGARAQTVRQQQAVSDLRTACDDVAKAQRAYGKNDTAGAATYAKKAYRLVQQAGSTVK
ncbi:MAG TPA: hypothetical protein VFL60_01185 [Gaiellaceae bacterium]|nr:hypothetical protein [Gaiellaceae bacterium]